MEETIMKIYLELIWAFFQVGLVSFGGGYAAMSPIYNQVVTKYEWITPTQFTDLITISQMTPGPISLNSATFVGLQIAGIPGAIAATIGNIIPSFIIVITLAYVYYRFSTIKIMQEVLRALRPAVVALIMIAAISLIDNALLTPSFNYYNLALFVLVLVVLNKTKLDPTVIMLVTGVIGAISAYFI